MAVSLKISHHLFESISTCDEFLAVSKKRKGELSTYARINHKKIAAQCIASHRMVGKIVHLEKPVERLNSYRTAQTSSSGQSSFLHDGICVG